MRKRWLLLPLFSILACSKGRDSRPYVNIPSVQRTRASASGTSIQWEAKILSDGNLTVREKGICWGNLPKPGITGNHMAISTAGDIFSDTISGLTPLNIYFIRAYATNAQGTAYSAEWIFYL